MKNKTDLKRKHILKAAFECFTIYGYSKSTFIDIAKRAGISRASLYLYFKNKEDLFITMYKEIDDEHAEKSLEILKKNRLDNKEKLSRIIDEWVVTPYMKIRNTPYWNSWLDELRYISGHTEMRYRSLFINSISPLVGKDLAQVIVLAIRGLMDDRPPAKILNKRIGILIENSISVTIERT